MDWRQVGVEEWVRQICICVPWQVTSHRVTELPTVWDGHGDAGFWVDPSTLLRPWLVDGWVRKGVGWPLCFPVTSRKHRRYVGRDLSESLFSALKLLDSLSLVISPHPHRLSNMQRGTYVDSKCLMTQAHKLGSDQADSYWMLLSFYNVPSWTPGRGCPVPGLGKDKLLLANHRNILFYSLY